MEDKSRNLKFHRFRMRFLFPVAIILMLAVFVNSISDAIVFSYLYLIDSGLCIVWFSLAVPTFIGFSRRSGTVYRWNRAYLGYMIFYLLLKMVLSVTLMHDVSSGAIILLFLMVIFHITELIYYRRRRELFI